MMKVKLYKPFEHWYNGGVIWLIADTHFDDVDCRFMDPNWVTPEEQVKLINSKVGKKDTLIHLGDVGNAEWVKKLKGYKVLITGNHDSGVTTYDGIFDEVYDGPLFINDKICLSHEPVDLEFGVNIHGHVHSGKTATGVQGFFARFNVAANMCHYIPQRLDDLVSSVKTRSLHRVTIDYAKSLKIVREWTKQNET